MHDTRNRCAWVGVEPVMVEYHDGEWGVPLHDDRRLFEFLVLDGAQAGLSWRTVLTKRQRYRQVFHGFDIARVAAMSDSELACALNDKGIIRNRMKVASVRQNARAALRAIAEVGSLDALLWSFVGGAPLVNRWRTTDEVPATTPASVRMSKALRQRGFSFVGPTICYALMQAAGMVNDHLLGCFRHDQV